MFCGLFDGVLYYCLKIVCYNFIFDGVLYCLWKVCTMFDEVLYYYLRTLCAMFDGVLYVKFCELFDVIVYDRLCEVLLTAGLSFVRLSVWRFEHCFIELRTTICVQFCALCDEFCTTVCAKFSGLFDRVLYDHLCEVVWTVWWRFVRLSVWSFVGCLMEICVTICVKFYGLFDEDLFN